LQQVGKGLAKFDEFLLDPLVELAAGERPPCSSARGASPTFWLSLAGPITTDLRHGS
jgi:hypothetical protein